MRIERISGVSPLNRWSRPDGSGPNASNRPHHLERRERARQPGHGAEHAELGAGVAIVRVEGVADEAAIAGLVRLPAAPRPDLRLELADRRRDEGTRALRAGVRDGEPGREIVRAVQHHGRRPRPAPRHCRLRSARAGTSTATSGLSRLHLRSATSGLGRADVRRCRTAPAAADWRASTSSSSITVSRPTPAAARYWMAGEPIPPAPTITTSRLAAICAAPRRRSPSGRYGGRSGRAVRRRASIAPSSRSRLRRAPSRPAPRLRRSARAGRARDELRDALAARDLERLAAEIDEDDLHLAAIVGVDRAGVLRQVTPCFSARPERGRTCTS